MLSWDDETVASRAPAQPRPHLQAVPTAPSYSCRLCKSLDATGNQHAARYRAVEKSQRPNRR